ncbi:uncharacterized protein TNCV_3063091 [Trichonephila clavipes]|nr:uncharacterized protein TNCV_3063091 [Trichonephila clavipes]
MYICTAGRTKCNTKKDQRYHSEIHLADNMLYKDQMIKITASCNVWMMIKSVVSVARNAGYNHCNTLRHEIKEALNVFLGYRSPCGFHILAKLIWCNREWCIPVQSLCKHEPHTFALVIDRENKQVKETI